VNFEVLVNIFKGKIIDLSKADVLYLEEKDKTEEEIHNQLQLIRDLYNKDCLY
jgi:hypothetical protein